MSKYALILVSIALIIILGLAVYSNSIKGQLVWDDEALIRDDVYIRNWSSIAKIFSEDIGGGASEEFRFWRPLQMLSYMIDYSIWKLNVVGYHLVNIILHILVALAICWLINTLFNNKILSLVTGLLFINHPIHTEAVSYISGRADPLSSLFILLSLILYIQGCSRRLNVGYILALVSYILALLSRENSLILPVLILLYHYTFKVKIDLKRFIPIVGLTAIYILLRFTLLKPLLAGLSTTTSLLERIPGFFVAITNYFRLLILPFNLHMEYGTKIFTMTNPQAIIGLIILAIALIYCLMIRSKDRLTFFAISFFLITILPQSNIYPINAYMAEHWLYLPSIGFFLILAKILNFLYDKTNLRNIAIAILIIILAFWSYLTVRQNDYWREPVAFYERTLKYNPKSPRIYDNLGNLYSAIGKKEEAITLFKKAIILDSNFAPSYSNLGIIYCSMGRKKEAMGLFERAITLKPNFAQAYNNLGVIYDDIGKTEEAISLYKKVIALKPNHEDAYNNLANAYSAIGKVEEAIVLYKKGLKISPNNASIYNNLGIAYINMGSYKEAIGSLKKAVEFNPDLADAYCNLGLSYDAIGKNKEAIDASKKAVAINPGHAMAHNNLAVAYYKNKQYDLAIRHCDRAIELGYKVHPEFEEHLKPYRQ